MGLLPSGRGEAENGARDVTHQHVTPPRSHHAPKHSGGTLPFSPQKRQTTLSSHQKHQKEPVPRPTLPISTKCLATAWQPKGPLSTLQAQEDFSSPPPKSLLPGEQAEMGPGWGQTALCPDGEVRAQQDFPGKADPLLPGVENILTGEGSPQSESPSSRYPAHAAAALG